MQIPVGRRGATDAAAHPPPALSAAIREENREPGSLLKSPLLRTPSPVQGARAGAAGGLLPPGFCGVAASPPWRRGGEKGPALAELSESSSAGAARSPRPFGFKVRGTRAPTMAVSPRRATHGMAPGLDPNP
ncbi:hypothetical protein NDU88_007021 [Pleurodeles waltl]|uniref:Uncharacterized protein n=1 Tax=Pleurodeles waltl TaxID=8319 RepID=A0AAV7UR88_PLEWA|nr:hypothetical protein NDU88_007021 [Pleurodeles waltl]